MYKTAAFLKKYVNSVNTFIIGSDRITVTTKWSILNIFFTWK